MSEYVYKALTDGKTSDGKYYTGRFVRNNLKDILDIFREDLEKHGFSCASISIEKIKFKGE